MSKIIGFLLCNMVYCICYVVRTSTNSLSPMMQHSYGFSLVQVGNLSTMFYLFYTLSQIPIGFLVDRYGPRKSFISGTSIFTIGLFLFSRSTSYFSFMISEMILGLGASFVFICSIKYIYAHFSSTKHMGSMSMIQAASSIGMLIASKPLSELLKIYPISYLFSWITSICFLALGLSLMCFPKDKVTASMGQSIKTIFTWNIMISGLYCLAICGASALFIEIHGGALLRTLRYSAHTISNASFSACLGSLTMVFLWSPLVHWMKFNKNLLAVCATIIAIGISLIMIHFKIPDYLLYAISFLIGGIPTSKVLFMSGFKKNVTVDNIGINIACINIFIPLGHAIVTPISNEIYHLFIGQYGFSPVQYMFYIMPILFAVASLIAILNYRKTKKEELLLTTDIVLTEA